SLGAAMVHAYMDDKNGIADGIDYEAVTLASPGYWKDNNNVHTTNFLNEHDPIQFAKVLSRFGQAVDIFLDATTSIGPLVDLVTVYKTVPGDKNRFNFQSDFRDAISGASASPLGEATTKHNKILYDAVASYLVQSGVTQEV